LIKGKRGIKRIAALKDVSFSVKEHELLVVVKYNDKSIVTAAQLDSLALSCRVTMAYDYQ